MKRLVLLLPLLLPTAGCFSLFGDTVDPIYEIDDEDQLVVYPFKEPGVDSPWDSTLGHQLAQATTNQVREHVDFIVRPYGSVLELLVAQPKKNKKKRMKADQEEGDDDEDEGQLGPDVRDFDAEKLAQLTDSRYVLICEIIRFSLKDPLNINMSKGTATVEAKLFKVAHTRSEKESAKRQSESLKRRNKARAKLGLEPLGKLPMGGKFVAKKTITARFPDDFLNQYGEPFMDPVAVRKGLIKAVADKVAKLLYEHEPEPLKGSGN